MSLSCLNTLTCALYFNVWEILSNEINQATRSNNNRVLMNLANLTFNSFHDLTQTPFQSFVVIVNATQHISEIDCECICGMCLEYDKSTPKLTVNSPERKY